MSLKSYKGRKLSGVLALLIIFSIGFAVLATLATLSPAVSADPSPPSGYIITYAWITSDPFNNTAELVFGNSTNVTLWVESVNATENVQVLYVLPAGVEYVENSSTLPPDRIIGNLLLWDIGPLNNTLWTVAFELYPNPEKINFTELPTGNISLNVLPYSRAVYTDGTATGNTELATTGGYIPSPTDPNTIVNFGFNVHQVGEAVWGNFNLIDHATGMHVDSESIDYVEVSGNVATFWGNATVNGTSGYQFLVNVEDKGGPGQDKIMIFITSPDGFSYTASDTIQGSAVNHMGLSDYVPFPELFVTVNVVENGASNIYADGRYIAQPVNINGYAKLKVNKTGTANVRTIICVDGFDGFDGFRIYKKDSNVSSDYPDADNNISVSTIWVPMSSGMHRISISTYVLNYKGEEVWNEDIQGPNEATTNKTIYIRRVR